MESKRRSRWKDRSFYKLQIPWSSFSYDGSTPERSSGSVVDNTVDLQSGDRKIDPPLHRSLEVLSPYDLVVGGKLNQGSLIHSKPKVLSRIAQALQLLQKLKLICRDNNISLGLKVSETVALSYRCCVVL